MLRTTARRRIISQQSKKVLALSIGQLLNTIISIVIMMVSARLLSMQELATYRQSLLVFQVATPFIGLGMGSALLYFLPVEIERRKSILIESLLVCTCSGGVIALALYLGGGTLIANTFGNTELSSVLFLIAFLMLFSAPNIVINSFLVVVNKVNTLSVYQVLTNLLVGIGVVVACVYLQDPFWMVAARVALLILGAFIALKIMFSCVTYLPCNPSIKSSTDLISYGLPLSMSMCVGMLTLQLDKIIVSAKTSPELFAIYSNGAMEIPLIGIITSSLCLVMIVPFRKAFSDNALSSCIEIYHKVSEKISFILLPVMMYFALVATPFIIVMYSEKYIESVLPFLLYLLIIPSRTLLQGAMAAVGKGKILLRNSIISLVLNGCLTFVLVNQFGYFGAIIATVVVLYCWDVMISLKELSSSLECKMMELYPKTVFIKLFLCSALSSAPTYILLLLMNKENAFLQLVVAALIYFPLYLLLGIKLKLFSEKMLSFISQNYNKIKLKLRSILGSTKW